MSEVIISRNSLCVSGNPPISYQLQVPIDQRSSIPSTNRFFSGRRFPLATLSNREDQIFSFGSPLIATFVRGLIGEVKGWRRGD